MSDDKKYSELDASGNLTGSETFSHLQVGKNVRSTLNKIKDWIAANLSFDSIKLNPTYEPVSTVEGEIYWNGKYYTPQYDTGLGVTIRDGDTEYWVFYNDTGAIVPSGKVMHLLAGFTFDGEIYPTFEYADASNWEKVQGTLAMTMHAVPIASLGILAKSSQKISADTTGFPGPAQLYISSDGSGDPTTTEPQFPNFSISIGASYDNAVDGCIFFNQTTDIESIFGDAWDGACLETFEFTTSSDGVTVTGTLQNVDPARNLPFKFSDNFYTFDTTPPATIELIPGTDADPAKNYVFIPKSTKVLTVNTSGFPTTEHSKIASLSVQSAATLQTESGAEKNQNINDHLKTTDDNGHILHISERIRQLNADHDSGTEATLIGTPTNGYINVTGGEVWQMHKQTFPSISMPTSNIIIQNDFTTANRRTNNLNTITAYSDGSSWNNEWSSVVVWGIANESGEPSFLKLNIPSAGYNSEANAQADALNYANYSIPKQYKGVGFLIARFVVRVSGGTIIYNGGASYVDLRGFVPNNIAGSSGGGGVTTLLALSDVTTSSYTGNAGKLLVVNSGETGSEFTDTIDGAKIFNDFISYKIVLARAAVHVEDSHLLVGNSTNTSRTYTLLAGYGYYLDPNSFGNVSIKSTYSNTTNKANLELYVGNAPSGSLLALKLTESGELQIQPPTTDSGSNDVLTYNSSTGAIEKTTRASLQGKTKTYQTLTSGTTETMNTNSGVNAKITLAHNCTLTISNLVSGDEGNIIVTQDAIGSRTLTISPTPYVINDGAGVITLTGTAASRDILSYTYDGTNLNITYGSNYTNS